MKKHLAAFSVLLLFAVNTVLSQTNFKDYTAGHQFNISLPDYMTKTIGLNSDATIQFKNNVKDIAGFVIEDNKEELKLAEMNFASINEFYENFINDFLKGEEKREISKPVTQVKNGINFIECDATYYDKDSKLDIYYFVGVAETKAAFYKVLCYGDISCKEKFKSDFQKILYSIKD